MKNNTVKYIIKVTPTFSQKFGFGVLSVFGGIVGGFLCIDALAAMAVKHKYSNSDKKVSDIKDSDKKVFDIKDFVNRVKKEESGKE